jgi:hypothetical protein
MQVNHKLAPFILGFVALSLILSACGKPGVGEKIIIDDPTRQLQSIPLYGLPGELGGNKARVNVGEFAIILERKQVKPGTPNATPGDWIKIRTIIQPREGWMLFDNTRPAPRD